LVSIGFCAAQAVVEVGGVENDAQLCGAGCEDAREGDGVGSAR